MEELRYRRDEEGPERRCHFHLCPKERISRFKNIHAYQHPPGRAMKGAGTVPLLERTILERYWELDKGFRRFAHLGGKIN